MSSAPPLADLLQAVQEAAEHSIIEKRVQAFNFIHTAMNLGLAAITSSIKEFVGQFPFHLKVGIMDKLQLLILNNGNWIFAPPMSRSHLRQLAIADYLRCTWRGPLFDVADEVENQSMSLFPSKEEVDYMA